MCVKFAVNYRRKASKSVPARKIRKTTLIISGNRYFYLTKITTSQVHLDYVQLLASSLFAWYQVGAYGGMEHYGSPAHNCANKLPPARTLPRSFLSFAEIIITVAITLLADCFADRRFSQLHFRLTNEVVPAMCRLRLLVGPDRQREIILTEFMPINYFYTLLYYWSLKRREVLSPFFQVPLTHCRPVQVVNTGSFIFGYLPCIFFSSSSIFSHDAHRIKIA